MQPPRSQSETGRCGRQCDYRSGLPVRPECCTGAGTSPAMGRIERLALGRRRLPICAAWAGSARGQCPWAVPLGSAPWAVPEFYGNRALGQCPWAVPEFYGNPSLDTRALGRLGSARVLWESKSGHTQLCAPWAGPLGRARVLWESAVLLEDGAPKLEGEFVGTQTVKVA